jgi:hypothetical protein
VRSWVVQSCVVATLAFWVKPVSAQRAQGIALSSGDSAAVLRSAFRFVTQGHNARQRVLWFWTPSSADSNALSFSPDVRAILTASGLTVSENRPVGDDTVVFRVRSWKVDSAGVLLEIRSEWTQVRRANPPCRTGSANVERLRLRRADGEWVTSHEGPVVHGDNACAPLDRTKARPSAEADGSQGRGSLRTAPGR